MNDATEISAIGKTISLKNAQSLKKAIATIMELLVDTKALNESEIEELIAIAKKESVEAGEDPSKLVPEIEHVKEESVAASAPEEVVIPEKTEEPESIELPEEEPEEKPEQVEAPIQAIASLKEVIERTSWSQRLRTTLDLFHSRFRDLNAVTDERLKKTMNVEPEKREAEIEATVADLDAILSSLRRDRPKPTEEWLDHYPMFCSAAEEGGSGQAIAFDFPIEAASEDDPNRHPVQGILFRIDEPSEAIPAIGPGLPLLIPREVAESVVNSVSGLPLDAHDNLDQHANTEIAGVMQAASIQDNDFVVSGLLWPWSQSKKVQAIARDTDKLGMSMNAVAKGVPALHNGTKVFKIEKLRLLGANILHSAKATYRKTRLISASEFVPDGEDGGVMIPITASASASGIEPEVNLPEDVPLPASPKPAHPNPRNPKMDDEIKIQLAALTDSVNTTVKNLGNTVIELNNELESLRGELQEVRRDYEARQEAIQAAAREKTEQTQMERLSQEIQAAVAKAVNPSGAPSRRTYGIAAAATTANDKANPERQQYELQLAALEGQLAAFQSLPAGQYDGVKVMQLIDQKNLLQATIARC